MKFKHTAPLEKIILISAPWPLYSRPSIQIGTLKSYLKKNLPDLTVHAHHFYLKVAEAIGYRRYRAISERTWLAETIYAALLYPERLEHIEKMFYKQAAGKSLLREILFETLTKQVQKVSETFIHTIDWGEYGLAGFSICLCQLTASLYFIRQVKKQFPNLFIVVGGPMFTADATRNLFKIFPEIDVAINGEGELPLSRLIAYLKDPGCKEMPPGRENFLSNTSHGNLKRVLVAPQTRRPKIYRMCLLQSKSPVGRLPIKKPGTGGFGD
jgi:hypothetical protein